MCSRCSCWKDKGSVYQDKSDTKETGVARRKTNGAKDIINSYRLGEILGSGAFGVVRSATKKGEKYAIKLLSKPRLKRRRIGLRSNALELLSREIAVWKKLNHPNICNLIEVINDDSHEEVYLVSEFIEGGMLLPDKRVVQPMEEPLARSFCRQILLGLEYLHAIGIAHRDIKPANILLTERTEHGIVKLCDFGVAEMWDHENGGNSGVKNTVGTMEFFAPEMCQDGGDAFAATLCDVWAVGVTLHMMLCGVMPAQGNSMEDLFNSIKALEVNISKDIEAKYDAGAFVLLRGLLIRNPDERWSVERALNSDWLNNVSAEASKLSVSSITPKKARHTSLQINRILVSDDEVAKAMSPMSMLTPGGTMKAIVRFNSFRGSTERVEKER